MKWADMAASSRLSVLGFNPTSTALLCPAQDSLQGCNIPRTKWREPAEWDIFSLEGLRVKDTSAVGASVRKLLFFSTCMYARILTSPWFTHNLLTYCLTQLETTLIKFFSWRGSTWYNCFSAHLEDGAQDVVKMMWITVSCWGDFKRKKLRNFQRRILLSNAFDYW